MRLDHLLSKEKETDEFFQYCLLFIFQCTLISTLKNKNGDIAQLARAPALQAGGQGFDSLYLHHIEVITNLTSIKKAHWKIYRKKKKYQGKLDIHYQR